MKNSGNHTTIIYAPRSLGIFLIQYMSIAPLGTLLAILSVVLLSDASSSYKDLLILFFGFIFPLVLIAFIMLYFPNQFRTRFIFDGNKNQLFKIKKKAKTKKFDLSKVRLIISKTVKTIPSCKYSLILEEGGESSQIAINEDTPLGAGRWEIFSEKLSKTTGLPLRKESWAEDLSGNLSLIPHEKLISAKKHGLSILLIPLLISFFGAILYKTTATFQALVHIGLFIVLINTGLSFLYALFNRDKMGDWGANYFILTISILTLLIPYTIFYLCFVFVLSGFQLPAGL